MSPGISGLTSGCASELMFLKGGIYSNSFVTGFFTSSLFLALKTSLTLCTPLESMLAYDLMWWNLTFGMSSPADWVVAFLFRFSFSSGSFAVNVVFSVVIGFLLDVVTILSRSFVWVSAFVTSCISLVSLCKHCDFLFDKFACCVVLGIYIFSGSKDIILKLWVSLCEPMFLLHVSFLVLSSNIPEACMDVSASRSTGWIHLSSLIFLFCVGLSPLLSTIRGGSLIHVLVCTTLWDSPTSCWTSSLPSLLVSSPSVPDVLFSISANEGHRPPGVQEELILSWLWAGAKACSLGRECDLGTEEEEMTADLVP